MEVYEVGFISNTLRSENNEIKMKHDSKEECYQHHLQNCLKKIQKLMY